MKDSRVPKGARLSEVDDDIKTDLLQENFSQFNLTPPWSNSSIDMAAAETLL